MENGGGFKQPKKNHYSFSTPMCASIHIASVSVFMFLSST